VGTLIGWWSHHNNDENPQIRHPSASILYNLYVYANRTCGRSPGTTIWKGTLQQIFLSSPALRTLYKTKRIGGSIVASSHAIITSLTFAQEVWHKLTATVEGSNCCSFLSIVMWKMRSSMAPRSVRFSVRSRKLSNVGQSLDDWLKNYYLELLRASKDTLSRWSRLHMQLLPPTNPHWPPWWVKARSPYV
jgi:hypothetical protein